MIKMHRIFLVFSLFIISCSRDFDEPMKIIVTKNEASTQEEIWLMDIDGSNETRLTSYSSENRCAKPSWSQNGKMIVYLQYDTTDFTKLMIMNSDGSGKKLVAQDSTGFLEPSFFADNKRVAVPLHSITAPYLFYIVDIDTGGITTLSTTEFMISSLSVSAKGTIMISEPSTDGGYQLWNADTGLSSLIVPSGTLTFSSFSWDSEGEQVIVYDGAYGLYIYNPSTQTKKTVLSSAITDTSVSLDPANEYIYFSSASGIQKIKTDGTGQQVVNSNPLYTWPQVQYKTR